MVITRCDWSIHTTSADSDPMIDGISIYDILVESLKNPSSGIYIEKGNCR